MEAGGTHWRLASLNQHTRAVAQRTWASNWPFACRVRPVRALAYDIAY